MIWCSAQLANINKEVKDVEVRTLGNHVSTTPEIPFTSNMWDMHVIC